MIRKTFGRGREKTVEQAVGFDAFDLRLGDLMRGERATMGKSLLDVQRELKIKAAYIAAIENADPSAFDTPGFIAGYVRSYARYLDMDPDWAFDTFCTESGFATAHGMSAQASGAKPKRYNAISYEKDIFASPSTPFVPVGDTLFANVEPRAIGSFLVLIAIVGGLGFGGWTLLQEVQKVQMAPVENAPTVTVAVDPLSGGRAPEGSTGQDTFASFEAPSAEALNRLYRPEALDVPVLVARDGPIARLDPRSSGTLAPMQALGGVNGSDSPDGRQGMLAGTFGASTGNDGAQDMASGVQVISDLPPGVQLVAVRPAWVRVRAADGSVIYETIMNAGDTFDVPQTEDPATLRIGESGAVYFAVNGAHYGPVGPSGSVTSNLALSVDNLTQTYAVADLGADNDLAQIVRVADAQGILPAAGE